MRSDLYLSDSMKGNLILFIVSAFLMIVSAACKKDQVSTPCESKATISFAAQIKPMIDNNCVSCHGSGGNSPTLTDHGNVATHATHILNTLTGNGAQLMPLGGPALNDSLISQFSCWISQGKQNN